MIPSSNANDWDHFMLLAILLLDKFHALSNMLGFDQPGGNSPENGSESSTMASMRLQLF